MSCTAGDLGTTCMVSAHLLRTLPLMGGQPQSCNGFCFYDKEASVALLQGPLSEKFFQSGKRHPRGPSPWHLPFLPREVIQMQMMLVTNAGLIYLPEQLRLDNSVLRLSQCLQ
jgi:hypothetical protein